MSVYKLRALFHMQLQCVGDPPMDDRPSDDPNGDQTIGEMPQLPSPHQRWTGLRKATVIEAVRGGWVSIEEICRRYNISADEFVAWERDLDRYGIPGLRTTRYQIYRDTEKRKD
jgi:hypothetical protein